MPSLNLLVLVRFDDLLQVAPLPPKLLHHLVLWFQSLNQHRFNEGRLKRNIEELCHLCLKMIHDEPHQLLKMTLDALLRKIIEGLQIHKMIVGFPHEGKMITVPRLLHGADLGKPLGLHPSKILDHRHNLTNPRDTGKAVIRLQEIEVHQNEEERRMKVENDGEVDLDFSIIKTKLRRWTNSFQ